MIFENGITKQVSWLQRCSHCWRRMLNLDIYDNLCFSCYWIFCHNFLLKDTDPHSILPEKSSLSGLIRMSSSLVVISLGSTAMFLKVVTTDDLSNDLYYLGTHKKCIFLGPTPQLSHRLSAHGSPGNNILFTSLR